MTTPNDDDLLKRLRLGGEIFRLCGEAADRIEALIAERDAAVAKASAFEKMWKQAEGDIAEGERRATAAIVAWLRARFITINAAAAIERRDHITEDKP
jgi:hypothetical protein